MPPITSAKLLSLEKSNVRCALIEGLSVVLRLLDNIINDPSCPKYRSFKQENKTIKEKVLSLRGMKDFLQELGFVEEGSGTLTLGQNVLIKDLRNSRQLVQARHDALNQEAVMSTAGPSKNDAPPPRPLFNGKYSGEGKRKFEGDAITHPYFGTLHQVLSYEDAALQEFGRSLVPIEKLRLETLERMRWLQKAKRSEDPVYEDVFIVVLTEWFNRSFFKWVNKVPCKVCGSEDGTRRTSYLENGVRVEEVFCCNQPSKFYRYNDIAKLLVTRKGRCGEYANCFTFLVRCLGYDARYIFANFDHVWTEVYSFARKRWIHVDPSDAVVDSPLMYQHGWKRSVDCVMAFSQYNVTDVTWRYNNDDRQEIQRRRSTDEAQERKLLAIYKQLQKGLSKTKKDFLFKRLLLESIELFPIRQPTDDERKGRSSGDLQWREMRGEQSVDAFYVFKIDEEEARTKQFNLRYSAAKDTYERFITGVAGDVTVLSSSKSWNSRVYSAKNLMRKEEHDWKMVYLARTENTNEAVIEWKLDVSDRKMAIKDVQLKFDTKTYENASIDLEFVLNSGEVVRDMEKVKNGSTFLIRARLTGGSGDNAWQHSQLFRQEMQSNAFPFELSLTFN